LQATPRRLRHQSPRLQLRQIPQRGQEFRPRNEEHRRGDLLHQGSERSVLPAGLWGAEYVFEQVMGERILITKEDLAEYERLSGDADAWAHTKSSLRSEVWYAIERAVEDFSLIDRDLASAAYE